MTTSAADLIKRLRDRGLSQTEISRRTGIPQPRLSRWQAGRAPAGADDALKLLRLEEHLSGAEGAPDEPAADTAGAQREMA